MGRAKRYPSQPPVGFDLQPLPTLPRFGALQITTQSYLQKELPNAIAATP